MRLPERRGGVQARGGESCALGRTLPPRLLLLWHRDDSRLCAKVVAAFSVEPSRLGVFLARLGGGGRPFWDGGYRCVRILRLSALVHLRRKSSHGNGRRHFSTGSARAWGTGVAGPHNARGGGSIPGLLPSPSSSVYTTLRFTYTQIPRLRISEGWIQQPRGKIAPCPKAERGCRALYIGSSGEGAASARVPSSQSFRRLEAAGRILASLSCSPDAAKRARTAYRSRERFRRLKRFQSVSSSFSL